MSRQQMLKKKFLNIIERQNGFCILSDDYWKVRVV